VTSSILKKASGMKVESRKKYGNMFFKYFVINVDYVEKGI
jgi:hypothetical protein